MEMIICLIICATILIIFRAFYQGKLYGLKKVKILSYGVNKIGNVKGTQPGTHAEVDALLKLIPKNSKGRLENINLIVIRVSRKNKLQTSKPCIKCIQSMMYISQKKGYRIKDIFYSDQNDNIVKSNLNSLMNDEIHLSSFFRHLYKKRMMNEKNDKIIYR